MKKHSVYDFLSKIAALAALTAFLILPIQSQKCFQEATWPKLIGYGLD